MWQCSSYKQPDPTQSEEKILNMCVYYIILYLFLSAWVQTSLDNAAPQLPEGTQPKNRKTFLLNIWTQLHSKWPCSPWVLIEHLPGAQEFTGLTSVGDSDLFFVLCSCHVDHFTFYIPSKPSNNWLAHSCDDKYVIHYKHKSIFSNERSQ